MKNDYDVIVAGLGAMGSAAAYHLAMAGKRVVGFDRFHPPHNFGSSHGSSRIIREAYFENPVYVPLVQRAYQLWKDLEKTTGRNLLTQTGGLMIGPPDGTIVPGAIRSAREHKLEYRLLDACEIAEHFPVLEPSSEMAAVWEPRAGVLFPEAAVRAHLDCARDAGATLRFGEPIITWQSEENSVRVQTAYETFRAGHLVLSAGPWLDSLVPELKLPLCVERQVQFWFEPKSNKEDFRVERCPIHIWETPDHQFFYGLPDLGAGVKVALHHAGKFTHPDSVNREVSAAEVETMRQLLRHYIPCADGPLVSTAVCMYTNVPDEHFVLDRHPVDPRILIVSPCSGHGFKFSSVIGEIVCGLVTAKPVPLDLSLFSLGRFTGQK
jgi:sarcosine oxidase